jgi:transposase InsO family protein
MWGRDALFSYIQSNHPKIGISRRQVMDFLKSQNVAQLYHPTKKTRDIQSTVSKRPYGILACDLMDVQTIGDNKGYNYLLCVIDLFSKYAWVEPIKNKNKKTVTTAMDKIIKRINHGISTIRMDNGSEFIADEFQNVLKKHNIKCVFSSAGKPWSNGQIERFNGILKQKIKMYVTQTDKSWVPVLQKLVDNYNEMKSRVTKYTPSELLLQDPKNNVEKALNETIKTDAIKNVKKAVKNKNQKIEEENLKVGDKVRLKLLHKPEEKQNEKWSREIFTINKVFKQKNEYSKPYYYVEDDTNIYREKLYRNDLQLVNNVENEIEQPKKWSVSKIVDKRVVNGKTEYLIQWKGYRKISDRTWEKEKDLRTQAFPIQNKKIRVLGKSRKSVFATSPFPARRPP